MYSFHNFPFLETSHEESPQTTINTASKLNSQSKTSFLPKTNINTFPLNEPFLHNTPSTKRKFTLEHSLNINDFVPKLKPLQIHFVPSKLRLNANNYKDYNINQQHISCPNTDESESISSENDDDNNEQYVHLKVTTQMKNLRKIMKRFTHNNIMKVFSKEVICTRTFDNDNEGSYLEEDDLYSDNENEYSNEEKYVLEGLSKGSDNNHNNNNKNKEGTNIKRVNSCSILQILENNLNMNII